MSYQIYKMIHIISIVLFFSLFAAAAYKGKSVLKDKILTGVFITLVLISGMGLVARIGIPHGAVWPLWLKVKLAIWFIIGASGHMIMKRFPQHAVKAFWISAILLTLASYMANYKISF